MASIMTLPADLREQIYTNKLIANRPVMLGRYHPYYQPQQAEQNFRKMMRTRDQRQEVTDFYQENNTFVLEVANLHPTPVVATSQGLSYHQLAYKSPTAKHFVVDPSPLRKLTYQCQKHTDEKDPWCQSYLELGVILPYRLADSRMPWRLEWRFYTTISEQTERALKDHIIYVLDWFGGDGDPTMIMTPGAVRSVSGVLWWHCDRHPWRPIPLVLR